MNRQVFLSYFIPIVIIGIFGAIAAAILNFGFGIEDSKLFYYSFGFGLATYIFIRIYKAKSK